MRKRRSLPLRLGRAIPYAEAGDGARGAPRVRRGALVLLRIGGCPTRRVDGLQHPPRRRCTGGRLPGGHPAIRRLASQRRRPDALRLGGPQRAQPGWTRGPKPRDEVLPPAYGGREHRATLDERRGLEPHARRHARVDRRRERTPSCSLGHRATTTRSTISDFRLLRTTGRASCPRPRRRLRNATAGAVSTKASGRGRTRKGHAGLHPAAHPRLARRRARGTMQLVDALPQKERERVAVLTTSYPRAADDPAGHFVQAEVRALERAGAEVHVFTPQGAAFGWPGAAARVRERWWRAASVPAGLVTWAARWHRAATRVPFDRTVAHWVVPSRPRRARSARATAPSAHSRGGRPLRRLPTGSARARVRLASAASSGDSVRRASPISRSRSRLTLRGPSLDSARRTARARSAAPRRGRRAVRSTARLNDAPRTYVAVARLVRKRVVARAREERARSLSSSAAVRQGVDGAGAPGVDVCFTERSREVKRSPDRDRGRTPPRVDRRRALLRRARGRGAGDDRRAPPVEPPRDRAPTPTAGPRDPCRGCFRPEEYGHRLAPRLMPAYGGCSRHVPSHSRRSLEQQDRAFALQLRRRGRGDDSAGLRPIPAGSLMSGSSTFDAAPGEKQS